MLKRIRIRGFKSLADVEVELHPLTLLIGPNASGKSNFLEALFLLSRLVSERTLAEAFEPPLRGYPAEAFSLPESGLPGLLTLKKASLSLEADVVPSGRDADRRVHPLRYRVGIGINPRKGSLEVEDEYFGRLKRDFSPLKTARIEPGGGHLVVRRLGEAGKPRQEPLGLNHTLVSNLQYSGETRYPDFDRLREELGSWRIYYLDPRVVMREPQPPRETTDIGPRGEYLAPFLHRLKESPELTRSFRSVARALHAAIPSLDDLDIKLDKNRGTLDIEVTQEGTPYSSRIISEGTLRVLSLCAIAANPWSKSLVAFEEPENGVHPRRIEVVANLLASMSRNRQIIITTHSPTLAATLMRLAREQPASIGVLRCSQQGGSTGLEPLAVTGPLFEDAEIRQALTGPDDAVLLEAMLLRGWMDG